MFTDYTTFKASIATLFSADNITTNDQIDIATASGEERINNEVRVPEMLTRDTSFSYTDRFTALPTGFLGMEYVIASVNGKRREFEFWTPAHIAAYDPQDGGSGWGYGISGTDIELIPAATGTSLEITYYKVLTSITGGTLNDVATRYPALYLFSVATEVALWRQDEKRLKMYDARYQSARDQANRAAQKYKIGRAMRARAM